MIKQLNKSTVEKVGHPVRILQFGEGNFLRAFVDWQIDIANEKGVMDAGIAVCQPIIDPEHKVLGMIDLLHKQDNMYHVYLEGIENKQPKKDVRLVKSVMDSFNPYVDYAKYEQYFLSPELKITISNTTEAGIRYEEGDDLTAQPPKSYPAKMTALLYKRFKHFNGDPAKGLCIICCELIENNGSTLHEYVIKHARYHKLGQDFIDWVETNCHFCDTLVDRIVPGFPREQIDQIKEEIGYDDNLVVKAELYHLWAIGGPGYKEVMRELPLDKAGLHVVFMPSIKQFRDKKVRILNGSHTGMVPIALQMGCETVMDAFDTPAIERFVNEMVAEEVIPMIEEDQDELKKFAAGILERFYNPFIKHMLRSISLNSLSKWEARNYPTVKDNWFKAHKLAERECFTFAALMTLYRPKSGFEPDDTKEFVEYIRKNWDSNDPEAAIAKIVGKSGIFTVDFSEVPGFVPAVAGYVRDIEALGMKGALEKFLA
ncbi:tagaturonate reductase [uncultured Alistipes sp.]|uniref:tagaturonate reductase n=1 Tax=uncultured Alistipes sp. TaxID=538949 RepID=UPI00258CB32A|nr:tagaturonate reductase [uncultured Alistipes sp.]